MKKPEKSIDLTIYFRESEALKNYKAKNVIVEGDWLFFFDVEDGTAKGFPSGTIEMIVSEKGIPLKCGPSEDLLNHEKDD